MKEMNSKDFDHLPIAPEIGELQSQGPSGPPSPPGPPQTPGATRARQAAATQGLALVMEGCALTLEGVRKQLREMKVRPELVERLDGYIEHCRQISGELQTSASQPETRTADVTGG